MTTTLFHDAHGAGNQSNTAAEDTSSTNAAAISLKSLVTNITTAGAETRTLAPGVSGQLKVLRMESDGGDCVVTLTSNPAASDVLTFGDALDFVVLLYADSQWLILVNSGVTVA